MLCTVLSCSVVSNSLQPHGLQPTRLLHPWDFPAKSTGVGCHCLLLSCFICVQLIASLWTVAARVLCQWNYPGKNIGVGCHTLLQGIFPIQGSNPGLPQCRQILYCLSHQGSPTIFFYVFLKFYDYPSDL